MSAPRVLVLRAPGINCERETHHAFARAGGALPRDGVGTDEAADGPA